MSIAHAFPPPETNLAWIKCDGQTWCNLMRVNLDHPHFDGLEGVYVIWHNGNPPRTVYVGQGNIADRLRFHRKNREVGQYSKHGLFVTWAEVDPGIRDGVEKFLHRYVRPLVGERAPDCVPVSVNFPW